MYGRARHHIMIRPAFHNGLVTGAALVIISGICGFELTGCSSRTFDRERFAQITARYLAEPTHKALYMNSVDYTVYQQSNGTDSRAVVASAERECKDKSANRGIDPEHCVPIYFDDQRLIDPDQYK
jgi:hypothetical protein